MREQPDNLCGEGGKERTGKKGRRKQGSSLSDKGITSKICTELLQLSKKTTYPIFKKIKLWTFQGRDMNGKQIHDRILSIISF